MEVIEDHTLDIRSPKDPLACEHCKSNPSKYKCPACLVKSCSLSCVKAHKQETGCSGRKNVTKFVPISQFDDTLILSDYKFLEEAKRVSESAQKLRTKLRAFNNFNLSFNLQNLRRAAAKRRTELLFFCKGMSMRESNRTRYEQRKNCILWTIEWRFHSTDVVLHDHCVNENRDLGSILQNHMKLVSWNHPLRSFFDEQLDCLKCFIRKSPMGSRSPFCKIDMKAPIKEVLAKLVILEYPVVHVFLPSHAINFEVDPFTVIHKPHFKDLKNHQSPKGIAFQEEEVIEDNKNSPNFPQENNQIPKGITFREEEVIEDNKSSPNLPQENHRSHKGTSFRVEEVIQNPQNSPNLPQENRNITKGITFREEEVIEDNKNKLNFPCVVLNHPSLTSQFQVQESGLNYRAESVGKVSVDNVEMDQGLRDSYSELLAKGHPDDFFDLGDDFLQGINTEGLENVLDLSGIFSDDEIEELEEGEILG